MFSLKGKSALVTGAARGIGFKIAEKLAQSGASVSLADINETQLTESVASLQAQGLTVAGVVVDVGNNDSIAEAVRKTVETLGGLDIVVNNAGILGAGSIEEMTRESWDRVLNINLSGTFFVSQAALPYLRKSPCARIINISSVTGRNGGFEGSMSYAASKGGVIAITRGMASRLAAERITVNAVCPGTTATDILKGYTPEAVDRQINKIPMKRLGEPDEIAAAVCYLASDEAAFVTGAMLDINGGAFIG